MGHFPKLCWFTGGYRFYLFDPPGAKTSAQEESWLPHCPGPKRGGGGTARFFPRLVLQAMGDWWFNKRNGWGTNSPGIMNGFYVFM